MFPVAVPRDDEFIVAGSGYEDPTRNSRNQRDVLFWLFFRYTDVAVTMNPFIERHRDKIAGVIPCFDRGVITGTIEGDKVMDTSTSNLPPKTNSAENETVTKERKMKSWSKPVVRPLGQTVYTYTGSTPQGPSESFTYNPNS